MTSEPSTKTLSSVKDRLKASYDAIAPTYNEWTVPHSKLRMEYLEKALGHLSHLSKNTPQDGTATPTFLELGCGHGLPVTSYLLTHPSYTNAKIIANDLSSTQIALARTTLLLPSSPALSQRLTLIEGDMMTALTFTPQSLTLVLAFYSIIHLPRDEQVVLISRVAEWLVPGGVFVGNFAVEEFEASVAETWLSEDKGWMYWSAWGKEKTLAEMRRAGLEVLVADVVVDEVGSAAFVWVVAVKRGEART